MMDIFFFLKTLALTLIVVLLMQIQIGGKTIETRAVGWIQSSMIVSPLQEVAQGGAKLARDLTHKVAQKIHKNVFEARKAHPSTPSSDDDEGQD
jgi:hypothetical protein